MDIVPVLGKSNLTAANYRSIASELESKFTELNSTGTAIGGTIGSLNRKLETIEHILVQPDYTKKLSLVESELKAIKAEILPQLENSKKALVKIEEFMKTNASFLVDLVSAEGRLRPLENEISSLAKRIEKIESEKNVAWNKAATIISIIVAIISTGFAVYFGFLK